MNKDKRKDKKQLYQNKHSFLIAAINDIAGNIRFLDTKVSVIVATIGVILGAFINCKSNILKVYLETQNNCIQIIIFLFSSIFYLVSQCATVYFAIKTITIREHNTLNRKSLWYIGDTAISYKEYSLEVQKINEIGIINNLAYELYKLNIINSLKMKYAKNTIVAFKWTCISICLFGANMIMFYLLVL